MHPLSTIRYPALILSHESNREAEPYSAAIGRTKRQDRDGTELKDNKCTALLTALHMFRPRVH